MSETCSTKALPVYLNKIQFITCWNYLYDPAQANKKQAESELMVTMLAFIYNILVINLSSQARLPPGKYLRFQQNSFVL